MSNGERKVLTWAVEYGLLIFEYISRGFKGLGGMAIWKKIRRFDDLACLCLFYLYHFLVIFSFTNIIP